MTPGGGAPPHADGATGADDDGRGPAPSRVAGRTHVGLDRAANEDAFATATSVHDGAARALAVVCDGIAGGAGGDRAALAAANGALAALVAAAGEQAEPALRRAVAAAHRAVCEATIAPAPGKDDPGTTLVAAMARGTSLDVAWVGDSRAYLVPPLGPPEQLTRDHSWVTRVVDAGELTEEEARASRWAQVITRCVGPAEDPDPFHPPEPSLCSVEAQPGSIVVLCTDGLWAVLPGTDALGAAVRGAPSLGDADALAGWLMDRALATGAPDDITVAVIVI
jgi:serine/threonine protein phosphatase PrpC